MRLVVPLSAALTVLAATGDARADPPSDSATVDLDVEVEGNVRAQGTDGSTSCTGPCTLRVAPGILRLSTPEVTQDIYVEAPSRVTLTRGVPALRTAGTVTLVAGVLVVVAAVAVPLLVCRTGETRYDPQGRPHVDPSPCESLGDGVKVAWIAGGGIGLTGAILGGVLLTTSGPKLRVTGSAPAPVSSVRPVGLSLVVEL